MYKNIDIISQLLYPFCLPTMNSTIISILILFNISCGFDDPSMTKMMEMQLEFEDALQTPLALFYMIPAMKYFPSKFMSVMRRFSDTFQKYIIENYNEHTDNFDKGTTLITLK